VTVQWVIYPQSPPALPASVSTARRDQVSHDYEKWRKGITRSAPPEVPAVQLICRSSSECPRFGDRVWVTLQYVAPGVLARPNFVCADCLMELAQVTEEEIHG